MSDPIRRLTVAIATPLDLSPETVSEAGDVAERAWLEHPVNRSDRVVAAGAIYYVALRCNEKRTQDAVAEAADVSVVSIRQAYRDIWQYEAPEQYARHVEVETDQDGGDGWSVAIPEWVVGWGPAVVAVLASVATGLVLVAWISPFRGGLEFEDTEAAEAAATTMESMVVDLVTVSVVVVVVLAVILGVIQAKRGGEGA